MKRLFMLVLVVIAFGAVGCGGSCKDACAAAQKCLTALGQGQFFPANCEDTCDAVSCDNKSDVLNCIEDISCPATIDAYGLAASACIAQSPACGAIVGL
jgi:hypothetical protein